MSSSGAFSNFRRRAHAGGIVMRDGVYHLVQALFIFGALIGVLVRCIQQRIDSRVELPTRSDNVFRLVKLLAGFESFFRPRNQSICARFSGRHGRSIQQKRRGLRQVNVGLYNHRRRVIIARGAHQMGGGRKEGVLEPGLLIDAASSGRECYAKERRGQERFRSIIHQQPRTMKINYFRRDSPGDNPKRL
jgi:hypothetical protein